MPKRLTLREAHAKILELQTELKEMTADRDYWEAEYDEAEAQYVGVRDQFEETQAAAPVADRASSIRDAIDAIPAQLRRDPRWRYDFDVLEQCVTTLVG